MDKRTGKRVTGNGQDNWRERETERRMDGRMI